MPGDFISFGVGMEINAHQLRFERTGYLSRGWTYQMGCEVARGMAEMVAFTHTYEGMRVLVHVQGVAVAVVEVQPWQ